MSTFSVGFDQIVAAAYGITVPTSATAAVDRLIEKAEGILLDEIPNLVERIQQGKTLATSVQSVVEDMVIRVLRNPQALRSISVDDGTATIDNAISSGMMYASVDELARLRKNLKGSNPSKIRSIRQAPPTLGWPHAW